MSEKKTGTQTDRMPEETRQGQAKSLALEPSYHRVRGNSKRKSHIRNDSAMSLLNRAADAVNMTDITVGNEWNLLAMMILIRATADWKKVGRRGKFHEYGIDVYRDELIHFFNGRWCGLLLECTDVLPEELMDAIGVPVM